MNPYKPAVSVILPFYKVDPDAFGKAVGSIQDQSFSDWELILVDNNAEPGARQMAESFATADSRIQIISEKQQGIAFALNTGLEKAGAELIARMDADDISFPQRLQKQYELLCDQPDIGVVSCQSEFASDLTRSEGYAYFVQWQNSVITHTQHIHAIFRESPLAHPSVMFRKSLIRSFGPYSVLDIPEDYELWLRWFEQGVIFYKIPEPLIRWNDHSNRLSRVHINYSTEAFDKVRMEYLARFILRNKLKNKKVVVCGAGKNIRRRAQLLEQHGVEIYAYADLKRREIPGYNVVSWGQVRDPEPWLVVNLITQRGVGEAIADHFNNLGFEQGRDIILAG